MRHRTNCRGRTTNYSVTVTVTIEQHTHHLQDIWHDGLHTNESCNSIGQMGWRLPLLQGGPKSKSLSRISINSY